ncbi:MAG: hypothetical protein KDD46_00400 [Bdellovibrionales bacterium]|nr:hypothetical protein [Bdellovibrionales bacterium]
MSSIQSSKKALYITLSIVAVLSFLNRDYIRELFDKNNELNGSLKDSLVQENPLLPQGYSPLEAKLYSKYISSNGLAMYVVKLNQNFIQGLQASDYDGFKNEVEKAAQEYNHHRNTAVLFYYRDTPAPDVSKAKTWADALRIRDDHQSPPNFVVQF